MVSAIVTAIGTAMTTFVTSITSAMVSAFNGLFWDTSATTPGLTNLAEGLLAIAGISLVIGCVIKVYHIFSGRVRKRV